MGKNNRIKKLDYFSIAASKLQKDSPEFRRRLFTIKMFGIIGILFTLLFGSLSLYNENLTLALTLFGITILLGVNALLMSKTENYTMGSNMIVYVFLVLFLYLVYTGGVANTGALWIYAFPALALFLHGFKRGLVDNALFVTLLTLMFVFFENALLSSYSDEYQLRLVFSFLLVTFLSSLYEYSNTQSIIERDILTEKLINVAKADQLTELKSRRGMYEEMETLYTNAKEKNEPLCLMLCDIDYLEDINNRYGHGVGDMVIKEIASEIKNSIKNTDCVSRWSGEEFLILLSNTELKDAHKFSLALEKRIENLKILHDKKQIQVSLSIGLSDIENVKSIYAAVRHADNEMYQSRKNTTTPL